MIVINKLVFLAIIGVVWLAGLLTGMHVMVNIQHTWRRKK